MKWLLVVYFLVGTEWVTADSIGMDGWGSIYYKTDEECLPRQHEFTDACTPAMTIVVASYIEQHHLRHTHTHTP